MRVTDPATDNNPAPEDGGVSLWQDAVHRLVRSRLAVLAAIVLVLEAVLCLVGPAVLPHGYEEQNLELTVAAPSAEHWLGTDSLGRDLLSRLLFGLRISLLVGIMASMVAVVVGVIYGAISGFVGGKLDSVMMRTVDVLYAVPFVFLVIILMVYFGRNFYLLFIGLGLTQWLPMARIVRGQVLSIKEKEFVAAARAMGFSNRRIIFKHVIPNTLGPVIVYVTLMVPVAMIEEAFLSFLGLGIQAPMASLGTLIADGQLSMEEAARLLLWPGATLAVTLMSLNFLGDGLRDALDPKSARD